MVLRVWQKIKGEHLKIEQIDSKGFGRVPLCQGKIDGRGAFVFSVLIDGTGVVTEFENGECWLIKTEDLVIEAIKSMPVPESSKSQA